MVHEPAVLIEGVLFRARYLGSTQLSCDGRPSKATRMMQAQEAVSRIKVSAMKDFYFNIFRADVSCLGTGGRATTFYGRGLIYIDRKNHDFEHGFAGKIFLIWDTPSSGNFF